MFGITEANDESVTYVRGLVSDQSCFEKIQSENADFTFSVTIQNHGYYNYSGSDFHNIEYVPDAPEINQYLTVSNLSDQAFAWLIRDLEKSDQKTIVLMFGDHQPGVVIAEDYASDLFITWNAVVRDLDFSCEKVFYQKGDAEVYQSAKLFGFREMGVDSTESILGHYNNDGPSYYGRDYREIWRLDYSVARTGEVKMALYKVEKAV